MAGSHGGKEIKFRLESRMKRQLNVVVYMSDDDDKATFVPCPFLLTRLPLVPSTC